MQQTLQSSSTPSQLVSEWSGTVAQLRCNLTEYDIVRIDGLPTLSDINRVFGNTTSVRIITNHLQSVMNYSGIEITENQLAETAMAMLTNYYFLNVAEWCLFFNELKAGKRGQVIWGTKINNQSIMVALHDFASDRRAALDKLEYEERQQDAEKGFNRIEVAASAIAKGIESVRSLKEKAKSNYEAFRELFPLLPNNYKPKDLFEAYGGKKEAIQAIYGDCSPSETSAHEDIYRFLCDYNVKMNHVTQ